MHSLEVSISLRAYSSFAGSAEQIPKMRKTQNNEMATVFFFARASQFRTSMLTISRSVLLCIAVTFCWWQAACSQPTHYSVSSKAQGASFDLVVTEVKREPNKSFISVPGFHNRTAPGARWLMCAYTDLAIHRGFSQWAVVYPPPESEVLIVAFSNSASASVQDSLKSDFVKERMLGENFMPVEKLVAMCGMRR